MRKKLDTVQKMPNADTQAVESGIMCILLKPKYEFLMICGSVLKAFSALKVLWISEEGLEGASNIPIG